MLHKGKETIREEEKTTAYFQHGLTIAHVRVALTLASIILQGDPDISSFLYLFCFLIYLFARSS